MAGTHGEKQAPPLCTASEIGDVKEVRVLLASDGCALEATDTRGYTPLSCCATNTSAIKVGRALIAAGANVNAAAIDTGATPLHLAAKAGNHDMVALLLRKGADLSIVDAFGRSALHWGALGGSVSVMTELLGVLPDPAGVDVQDGSGYTALMVAAEHGREEIVSMLIGVGADKTLKNKLTHTAPELADWYGRSSILKRLTEP